MYGHDGRLQSSDNAKATYCSDVVHSLAALINLTLDPMTIQVREQMVDVGRGSSEFDPLLRVVLQQRDIHELFRVFTDHLEVLLEVSDQVRVQVTATQRRTCEFDSTQEEKRVYVNVKFIQGRSFLRVEDPRQKVVPRVWMDAFMPSGAVFVVQ